MSKKLLVLAVLAVAGRSYCEGDPTPLEAAQAKLTAAQADVTRLEGYVAALEGVADDAAAPVLAARNIGEEGAGAAARRAALGAAVDAAKAAATAAEAEVKTAQEAVDKEAADAEAAARSAWFRGEQSRFQRPVRAGMRWATNPLSAPGLSWLHRKGGVLTELGFVVVNGAILYKTGVFGWVRKNVIGKIPGMGVDAEEAEEAADAA